MFYLGTYVAKEADVVGPRNVTPLVPSWFEREERAEQTVHITAALSGTKFILMSLSCLVKL